MASLSSYEQTYTSGMGTMNLVFLADRLLHDLGDILVVSLIDSHVGAADHRYYSTTSGALWELGRNEFESC